LRACGSAQRDLPPEAELQEAGGGMGGGWLARRDVGDFDDIGDWMAQRNADVALRPDAEAAGREAWEQATQNGQDLAAAQPSDVVALGADVLNQGDPGAAAPGLPSSAPTGLDDPTQVGPFLSVNTTSSGFGFAAAQPSSPLGPALAQVAGFVAGLFRGALHTGADALRTAYFTAKAANPLDGILSGPGESARDQIADTVGRLGSYADDRISHPDHFGQDVRNVGHQVATDLLPEATPNASTPEGEQLRRFRIGENQGELGFNGALALAAPASELGEFALQGQKAANVARFTAQGFSPETTEFLASSYDGMGHHSLPRRAGWPADVADSSFFLLKPPWMNRGRFYERHYAVDPKFYGAKIRASAGGGSWSGNALGLKKYGSLGQVWFGTTTPLKTSAAAVFEGNNALTDQVIGQDGPW
jgi:hypothetical protein